MRLYGAGIPGGGCILLSFQVKKVAILLCSANDMVLERWNKLLSGHDQVSQAGSLAELRQRLKERKFDLLLLHRAMVDTDTLVAIRRAVPSTRIFLLSDRPDEEEGVKFLRLGISGYSNTYIAEPRLLEAVRIVLAGSLWIGRQIMQRLIQETVITQNPSAGNTPPPAKHNPQLESLTSREREVAELVARGQSNLEIAAGLNITERTVKAHLSSIYGKTDTGSRLSLALLVNREAGGG